MDTNLIVIPMLLFDLETNIFDGMLISISLSSPSVSMYYSIGWALGLSATVKSFLSCVFLWNVRLEVLSSSRPRISVESRFIEIRSAYKVLSQGKNFHKPTIIKIYCLYITWEINKTEKKWIKEWKHREWNKWNKGRSTAGEKTDQWETEGNIKEIICSIWQKNILDKKDKQWKNPRKNIIY